jgi:multiple sugar transport system permease protein
MIMRRRFLFRSLRWIAFIAILIVFLFPLFWIMSSSVKAQGEFFTRPPIWVPSHAEWSNYPDSLGRGAAKGLTDSFTIAFSSMLVSLLLGAPAAYAIARFQIGRKNLAFWILSIRMFPPIATILPLFVIFRFAGLVDSYAGLILSYTVFNLPFAIWMLKGFIEDLPREIEEAAKVDGASRFQIFRNIVVPLVAPGLVVVALFTFIFAWNDFAYAVIFSGSRVTPLPVVIAQFAGGHEILWGQISAAAIIAIIPALILATFLQKYLTRGLTMGAIK